MADTTDRKIIHVDMDAFFASVEQRDDPALRGKPVAVGYAGARGVVAAASYEARKFSVRSALPSVTALRKCPELIFVPPRFDVYKAVSRQIHAIFADYTDLVQPLSLDEVYLDITANRRGIETAWKTAKEIRARIREETGLTASAGISYNKFLAKLASDQRKPNGQFAVTPDMGAAWVETLPVSRFHGVGPVTAKKMAVLGIETGADLRDKSFPFSNSISAARPNGTTGLRAESTSVRSTRIARESRQGPKPPLIGIWSMTARLRRVSCARPTTYGAGARRSRSTAEPSR